MIDVRSKVIPGVVNSHNHMLRLALEKQKVPVSSARPIADLLAMMGDACKEAGPDKWIVTSRVGFEVEQLKEGRTPNRSEMDTVSPNNPVIHEEDKHYSVVNSCALRLTNIAGNTPQPKEGTIFKEPDTGEPTGWLYDSDPY
jgi:predicted amidohydrolase YtcJ